MKTNKIYLALSLFLSMLCVSNSKPCYTINKIDKIIQENSYTHSSNDDTACCHNEYDAYVSLETETTRFSSKDNVVISYYVNSKESVVKLTYEQSGFNVYSLTQDERDTNRINVNLSCIQNVEKHFLKINITLESGIKLTAFLYAFENECGTFISTFSHDDAYQKFLDYAKDNNVITSEEYNNLKTKLGQKDVLEKETINRPSFNSGVIKPMDTSSVKTRVKGKLEWIDDFGFCHPLRRVMIRIYDKEPINSTLLATTYCENDGTFLYEFDNPDGFWDFENGGNDIFIRVYAGTTNAMVKNGNEEEYYYESQVVENVTSGTTITKNISFNMSSDIGCAFQISQAILTARDYAWAMMGKIPNDVSVRYPFENNCYYTHSKSLITISGDKQANKYGLYPYSSWDVITHEYGHHISHQLDITDSPGGKHNMRDNLAETLNDKDKGVRLAWAESWATIFGMQAQNYWGDYLENIHGANDTTYDAYNFKEKHPIEKNIDYHGDACESSIMAVLWDLYDSDNETNDTLSFGYKKYWEVTTASKSKKFTDFIDYFYKQYPEYVDDIGLNLTRYKMATSKPYITNLSSVSQTVPPNFSWLPQGGTDMFPNNLFSLTIYDSLDREIIRTSLTNSSNYTLSKSEWESVLYAYGDTYRASVAGVQTKLPITGEYFSEFSTSYTKPNAQNLLKTLDIAANDRYIEEIIRLQPGQFIEYKLTFASDGNRLIQTFGPKDSRIYLYDDKHNLLIQDDDSGSSNNALINYTFKVNTSYILRIQFYNNSESGEIKLGITPASNIYSLFENIWNVGGTSLNYYFTSSLNSTSVMTFTPSEYGVYDFTTNYQSESRIDTCLYVIDPTNTNAYLFNDDGGGNLQAKITTDLLALRTYFIVVSTYNITSTSGPLTLFITKTT